MLRADEEREAVAARFRSEGPASLPVTDSAGTLLGVVSSEEILRIEREEATEDFQKFGGAEELELSYTRTPLFSLVRKRAGWLVVLFLSEMLTASAMGHFDDEIARAVVLALFVPLVISSGGNSGSQAASLIIRALALGELSMRNIGYVLRKELLSGLLLGAILGAIGFIRIVIWQATGLYDYGPFWGWVGVSVAVSLLFIVLWGNTRRSDDSPAAQTHRARPGNRLGTLRGHACRRYGTRNLLLGSSALPDRQTALITSARAAKSRGFGLFRTPAFSQRPRLTAEVVVENVLGRYAQRIEHLDDRGDHHRGGRT